MFANFRKCATIRAITVEHLKRACQEALSTSGVNAALDVVWMWRKTETVVGQHRHSTSANRSLLSFALSSHNSAQCKVLSSIGLSLSPSPYPVLIQTVSDRRICICTRAHEIGNGLTLRLNFVLEKSYHFKKANYLLLKTSKCERFTLDSFTNFVEVNDENVRWLP